MPPFSRHAFFVNSMRKILFSTGARVVAKIDWLTTFRGMVAIFLLPVMLCAHAQQINKKPPPIEKFTELKYEKYALVIGNSNYGGPVFKKIPSGAPVDVDIKKVNELLISLGFPKDQISIRNDLDSVQLKEAINDFFTRIAYRQLELKRNKTATPTTILIFFYYSGHGASIGNTNYLIPTDFGSPRTMLDATKLSYAVDDLFVRHRMISSSDNISTVLISVIDACRDRAISFENMLASKGGDITANPRRLDSIPEGMLIAYASSQLSPANDADEKGRPSVFTRIMLEEYGKDLSVPIRQLFQDQVRPRMRKIYNDLPGLADQLLEDFPLNVASSGVQFSNAQILASLGKPIGTKGADNTKANKSSGGGSLEVIEGCMWLGDYKNNSWSRPKVADINANLISKPPQDIRRGERVIAAGRLNIKETCPEAGKPLKNNDPKGNLGTVKLGEPVEILELADPRPNNAGIPQYFAMVRVAKESVSGQITGTRK